MANSLLVEGLTLSVLTLDDLAALHRIFSDPDTHAIGNGSVRDVGVTHAWLQRREQRRQETGVTWYGIRDSSGVMIGNVGIFMGRTDPHPELGFEIQKAWQRQGYGRAAARAVVEEAHRAGFDEVWATVRQWNIGSRRALDAIGFTHDRVECDDRGELIYLQHRTPRPIG
jgi:RimJ/RimL family protein N-acetyltransferase